MTRQLLRQGLTVNRKRVVRLVFADGASVQEVHDDDGTRLAVTIQAVVGTVRAFDRSEAWLARQGFGRMGDGGRERGEEDALSVIQSASVAGRSAVGGGVGRSEWRCREAGRFSVPHPTSDRAP